MYIRLSTFKTKKITGKKERYANYVDIPSSLLKTLIEAADKDGYKTTNELIANFHYMWKKESLRYGIHPDNPYKGEYFTDGALGHEVSDSIAEYFYFSVLDFSDRAEILTIYEHGGYSSGYGVYAHSSGTARPGECEFKHTDDQFPPITEKLPEGAFSVTLYKPVKIEGNYLYFENGTSIQFPGKKPE